MVLNVRAPIIMTRLKEKIMTIKEPRMDSICSVKNDMGKPKIMALFLIFL